MSIAADYQKHLDDLARAALREAITRHPTTSVGELRELVASNPSLGGMTLAELTGRATGSVRVRGRAPSEFMSLKDEPAASARTPKRASWETRTEAGREALDKAVMEALAAFGGISVSAEAIRARVGATAAQIRTSLNRQIAAGELSFSGKARGTRYSIEG
jgi:hypothetical protein